MELTKGSKFRVFKTDEKIQMGLNLENTHTLMNMLRNNIYSDPLGSFVREVYSNAVDAHTRAKNTRDSIEIHLNRKDTCYEYVVRDYGDSMDKEKIASVYAVLGKSDKTSDNSEVGGFGIGASSPLAYTDHFFIETWTEEAEGKFYRKWVQYIDETRVGAIGLQEERLWGEDERKGTRITVPFKNQDYGRVCNMLNLYLHYTKAKYTVQGVSEKYKFTPVYYNQVGKSWAIRMSNGDYYPYQSPINRAMAIVGNIPYRINVPVVMEELKPLDLLGMMNIDSVKDDLLKYFTIFVFALPYAEWELHVDIGSVDLSASREDLQYTPKTIRTIIDSLFTMFKEILEGIKIELLYRNSFVEACKAYANDYSGCFKNGFLDKLKWQKEDLFFHGRKSIASQVANITYHYLDTIYSNNNNKKTVIRKDTGDTINLNTTDTDFIIVKNDTKYVQFSKFLKYFLHKVESPFNTRIYVVPETSWNFLYGWVKDSFKIYNLSYIVDLYKEDNPSVAKLSSTSLAQKEEFKTFIFANCQERERADGLGFMFKDWVTDKCPNTIQYYLSEEELGANRKLLDISSNRTDTLNWFRKYLKAKGIKESTVFYTKKYTRNYSDENWVNLVDIMLEDAEMYRNNLTTFWKHAFKVFLYESQYDALTTVKVEELKYPEGRYACLIKSYRESNAVIVEAIKSGKHTFFLMTSDTYRQMVTKQRSKYNLFKLEELSSYGLDQLDITTSIEKIMKEAEDFFNNYPLLRYVNERYVGYADSTLPMFIKYADLMTKERQEHIMSPVLTEEVSRPSVISLREYLEGKY